LAEAELKGETADEQAMAAEIAPCFVANGGSRTDTIVLACTHFPLLLDRLTRLSPWPVTFIDPAPAIARRVVDLIGPAAPGGPPAPARAFFRPGRRLPPALRATLAGFGLRELAPRFDSPAVSA